MILCKEGHELIKQVLRLINKKTPKAPKPVKPEVKKEEEETETTATKEAETSTASEPVQSEDGQKHDEL